MGIAVNYTDEPFFDYRASKLRHTRVQLEVEINVNTAGVRYVNRATGDGKCVPTKWARLLLPRSPGQSRLVSD